MNRIAVSLTSYIAISLDRHSDRSGGSTSPFQMRPADSRLASNCVVGEIDVFARATQRCTVLAVGTEQAEVVACDCSRVQKICLWSS